MSKRQKNNEKSDGLYPRGTIKLDSLQNVRAEMARLYRLSLKGIIAADECSKFVYVLKEIRVCTEANMLEEIQVRLAGLTTMAEARNGRA